MRPWLKKMTVLLTIPFLALVLTACPEPGDAGELEEPGIEEPLEGEGLEGEGLEGEGLEGEGELDD